MQRRFITNVQLATPNQPVRPVSIELSDDGKIDSIHESVDSIPSGSMIELDGANELTAFAGFIDIHTHGAMGCDLTHGTEEAVRTIAEAKLKEGVTTFLPTTWTETVECKKEMAAAAAAYRAREDFARAPFMHIEGPYLNPSQAGAQDPKKMRDPDIEEIRELAKICPIGIVSLAVELPGALDFIRAMKADGIRTSVAHSAATHAEFLAAREAGLNHMTHFCNQMSGLHHREIGLVGSGFKDDSVMIELICDEVHLAPEMIALVFEKKSTDQLMLITDSIAASHLGDGEYPIGDTVIIVKDGQARIPAGNLAGSILEYNVGVKNVAKITGLNLDELSKTTGANQARSLGLNDRGTIEQGLFADLTLLDREFAVQAVFLGGKRKV